MSGTIKVSVVVPIYNMEKYLCQCLDSIVSQTLRDIEIICVDDGSTDSSSKLLADFAAKDPRVLVIRQQRQGVSAARNAGIARARGQYLSILDADDYFHLDMLEHAYFRAAEMDADICIFMAEEYNETTGQTYPMSWWPRRHWLPEKEVFSSRDIEDRIFNITSGWAWDKLFRRSMIRKHGITFQNQRTTNDARFVFMAYALAERICLCENAIAIHRVGRTSALSMTREQSWDCFYKAFLSLEEKLKEAGQYTRLEHAMQNWVEDFALWNLDTITGKRREDVFALIKSKVFPRYTIWQHPHDYFLWPEKHTKSFWIKDLTFDAYTTVEQNKSRVSPSVIENDSIAQNYRKAPPLPKVTVIIPTFNSANDICGCLNCAIAQTLKNIEIICIDAGSHDGTLQLLCEYAKTDPRVSIQTCDEATLDEHIQQIQKSAQGEYVAILAPDNRPEPDVFESLWTQTHQSSPDLPSCAPRQ